MNSILATVRRCVAKIISDPDDQSVFDDQLIIHINSALSTLTQLGVGPKDGFKITGSSELWSDFIADNTVFELVKEFVVLRVQMAFDPPSNSFLVDAIKGQLDELSWRILVYAEEINRGKET